MAGIYIHIPFCKKRCIYCDFFSSTSIEKKNEYIDEVSKELIERKSYLNNQKIQTIYFGGGTPSQLDAKDFEQLFSTIQTHFELSQEGTLEITLEANPDDINPHYLHDLKRFPFNRISLGTQSFHDNELKFLNRRHNSLSAIEAIRLLQDSGFENISIDLIYGIPGQTISGWEETLNQAISLNVQHISSYHLIYEEDTALYQLLDEKKINPVNEELSNRFFEILIDKLETAGFEHYEISNFAKPGFRSKHNSGYWNGMHYLGVGASAHSYNGISRSWNKKTLSKKYRGGENEMEIIDKKTAYNDFIITRLRTKEGINLRDMEAVFGKEKKENCLRQSQKYIDRNLLQIQEKQLSLTRKGIFISDGIMSDLFL